MQRQANALQCLIGCCSGSIESFGDVLDRGTLDVASCQQVAALGTQLLDTGPQGLLVQVGVETGSLLLFGNQIDGFLAEDQFAPGDAFSPSENLEMRNVQCPGQEIGIGIEPVELFPKPHVGFLVNLIGVVPTGNQAENIGVDPPLVARKESDEQFALLLNVELFRETTVVDSCIALRHGLRLSVVETREPD